MVRIQKLGIVAIGCAVLSASGCQRSRSFGGEGLSHRPSPLASTALSASSYVADFAASRASAKVANLAMIDPVPSRYVAVIHHFEIIEPSGSLERSWQALAEYCATVQCEIVSSNINTQVENVTPSGLI